MAIHHHHQNHSSLLDALYCEEEEQWEEEGEEGRERDTLSSNGTNPSLFPLLLLEHHDLFWEDEELLSLFSKEQETHTHLNLDNTDSALSVARKEAVEWILKVNACYGFTPLTAILAINYLDRFFSSLHFQREKPWMIQLLSVTCLSLAAKVEETQVLLLLDLQVDDTKYVFDAKTIQRMELLVLSALQWRMNPVTPISFLDHIMRRLGLKTNLHWEFLRRCEKLLLSLLTDSRFVRYLPSVLAASTMLYVIHQVEPCHSIEYQTQLLGVLNLSKEKVSDCYELILEVSSTSPCFYGPHKRKYEQVRSSPSGVIDAIFTSDSSNDSWAIGSSVSSSPEPLFKKSRSAQVPSLNRVFVDAVGSPD
ncbi:Cyclin-D3-1 like [Actinidia chinensis var. chinensis]|uniref:Cyclin-D3-1 like n=1 Tax=Actinidia chinensis var. chinensis TaxID=1590841 RepID=A0A2R6RH26_ACTCC|nr:Cyclin-D3-1 like [Actinidia chinensis var. chinensis]